MRGWLVLALVFVAAACGGPVEPPAAGKGLRPRARGLAAPAYHSPSGRWRARHGELVALPGRAPAAGFDLGECLVCHQAAACDACHAYAGVRELPGEARP